MRIQQLATGVALVPLFIASSAMAAPPPSDIQIWSNEKELENGNALVLDADNTGGDITLQFGDSLSETFSWDSTNNEFTLSDDINITGNISLSENINMVAGATVDGVDISELGTTSAALQAQVNTNTSNIAGNTTNITGNATDISALQAEQTTQNTNISNNTSAITSNDSDISDLETLSGNGNYTSTNYISFGQSLTAAISALDSQIKTNTDNITAVQGATTSLNVRVTANEGDIVDLQTEQGVQNTNIANNSTAITSNDSDISTLQAEQATQNSNITTNASDISALETEQSVQNTDINNLETLSGNGNFTGATYVSFGSSLTNAILALDAQISTNTSDIATNANDITALQGSNTALQTQVTQNSTDITNLESSQVTQNTNIATNATDITALETGQAVQDTNIATNATDIDAIETWMAEEKPEQYQVDLGSVVVRGDGSDNIVNIFRGSDTGANPHHYNKVISSQSSLQDIETEYKILIGADNKSFRKLIFNYKNDGPAADSKFDIVLKDAAGNIIDQQIGVNSSSWQQDALDASSATVSAGDYLYLSVTSYTRNDKSAYFGDIYLDYGEER